MALSAIFFVQHLPAIGTRHPELRRRPGFVIFEVLDPLHHEEPDHRAKLRLRRVGQELPVVDREILRILAEPEEPILVVPLTGRYQRRALRPADQLAVLFNQVTAETGVGLVGHAAERRVELADLREIEGPDFHPRVFIVLFEILGNTQGLVFADHRMPRRPLRQIPAISLWIQRRLFPRQVTKQP
jgi:hypothetical protein